MLLFCMNSKISLIVPVFNEAAEIENFFNELKHCDFNKINEIIFVDDCSSDNSIDLLNKNITQFKENNFEVNIFLINNLKIEDMDFPLKKVFPNQAMKL